MSIKLSSKGAKMSQSEDRSSATTSQNTETYLITSDIVPTVRQRKEIAVSPEEAQELHRLEEEYVGQLEQYIPEDVNYEFIRTDTVQDWMDEKMSESQNPVVSIDDVYPSDELVDAYLDATRITDKDTGESVTGTRSGVETYDENIDRISSEYDKIDLVDIGAFTGGTIEETINDFEEHGVEVDNVYLPVNGSDLDVESMEDYTFRDWLELRDLFLIDGRKVGEGPNKFIPYSENLAEWAAIPEEFEDEVEELSMSAYEETAEILGVDKSEVGEHVPFKE